MQSLTITLIQSNLFWENKPANLEMFSEKISRIEGRPEVVVLPEMFSTGFSMNPAPLAEPMDGPTIRWMQKTAAKHKIILTGSIIIEEHGKYYNRLIWMLPTGTYGKYDKRHLFAYAGEDAVYTPGASKFMASVKGWKISLQICYDLRFPVWTRQDANNTTGFYDVLINVANWPEKRSLAWKTLLQARAIENQCFAVGVNRVGEDAHQNKYTGDSMLINPMGSILYHKSGEEDIATFTLTRDEVEESRQRFPFLKDADEFIIRS